MVKEGFLNFFFFWKSLGCWEETFACVDSIFIFGDLKDVFVSAKCILEVRDHWLAIVRGRRAVLTMFQILELLFAENFLSVRPGLGAWSGPYEGLYFFPITTIELNALQKKVVFLLWPPPCVDCCLLTRLEMTYVLPTLTYGDAA